MARKIIRHFPLHRTYVEPFGGSAAVLLAKSSSPVEVYNDLDQRLANLFRVLRDPDQSRRLAELCADTLYSRAEFKLAGEPCDDPVEAARRFLIRQRQSHGGIGRSWSYCIEDSRGDVSSAVRRWLAGVERIPALRRRLRNVQIECDDWSAVIDRYDGSRTLFYLDPPYPAATRQGGGYHHELSPETQHRLVERLLSLRGMAVLSGYACDTHRPLEDAGWHRIDHDVPAYTSPERKRRLESLWVSPSAVEISRPRRRPRQLPTEARQAMRDGARHTHQRRSNQSERRIRESIVALRSEGGEITISAVARRLSMSREHLSRRYRHLFREA